MKCTISMFAVLLCLALPSRAFASEGGEPLPPWALGPFVKLEKPVLSPNPEAKFRCPVAGTNVLWEGQNVYNPAAVVKDGKVYLLYRADDKCWWKFNKEDQATSRIGLAWSEDGRRFTRHPTPVVFPGKDAFTKYEWPGGCQDVHVVEGEDGVYYMNYTAWGEGGMDSMCVATSKDLIHWQKHGPAFAKFAAGAIRGSRSGVVVTRQAGERLLPVKINSQYVMYYTHPSALAVSDNLIDWKLLGKQVWGGQHESGAIALWRDDGILLMFNGQNLWNLPLPKGTWALGQALIDRANLVTVRQTMGQPFLQPEFDWEKKGYCSVPATVANGLVYFKGEWLLYYGAADRHIGLATCRSKTVHGNTNDDSFRYRLDKGRLGDTIPFYYKGQYHVFYLTWGLGKTSWDHIVSTDLVHWKKLPTALISDGAADGPDGENMFTGCVIEKDGVFHAYYTGWNPRNTQGREWIMQATSTDLVKWTKHPENGFRADGVQYFNRDFRDPYVFWNDTDKAWWMVLNTTDAKTDVAGVGRLRSEDLIHWKQLPPLVLDPPLPKGETGTPECPDLFRSGQYWYLLYTREVQNIRRSKDILGPYRPCEPFALDGRILCGKRMFDGKRHIYVAPLENGVMCMPRELYAGPEGQLCQRPPAEVIAFFNKPLHQFDKPREVAEGFVLQTPGNYMLECSVQLDPQATLTITMRQQPAGGDFRSFVLRPKNQDVEFGGPSGRESRRCPLDASKAIKFQAFVQDSTIECFVNAQYAFTFGARNYPKCALSFKVDSGKAEVLELTVKTRQTHD